MNTNLTATRILSTLTAARAVADVARQLAAELPPGVAGCSTGRLVDEIGGAVLQLEAAADEVLRFKEALLLAAARLAEVQELEVEVPEVHR